MAGVEEICIVMGDETTPRTRQVLVQSQINQTNASIESYKERDESLTGSDNMQQALEWLPSSACDCRALGNFVQAARKAVGTSAAAPVRKIR